MKQRKMNLAAFVVAGPVSGHHGGWRYPTADRNLLSLEYYRNIGRILVGYAGSHAAVGQEAETSLSRARC